MHPLKNIVIANVGEFLFPRPVPGSEARMELIEHIFADHALCWAGDDSLVITQFPSHEAFVNDLCRILGYHNVQVATPLQVSGSLCENIVADTHLFPFLVETLRCSPNAQIVFCGATRQLYALLDRLRQERVEFQAPDLPFREHYGIVPYLDSKVGFHEFCLKLGSRCPDLLIPAGWICETVEQAIQTAATLIAQQRSIVIKANEGDANIGIEIYTPERIERLRGETLEQRIRQHLNTWRKEEPVLIQEYISPSIHAETPSPCIQALITAKGQTHVIGIASQLVGPNGRYQGAEVSPHLFPPTVRECLFAVANAVGEAAAAQGYRGFFGIDTVLDEHGVLYCIEMNARRIASLVLFDVAREVSCQYGLRASDLSLRCENLNLAGQPYATLHSRLTPLLFPKEGKPEGVLFVGTPTGASGAFKLLAISEEIRTSRALCLQARALLGGSDSL